LLVDWLIDLKTFWGILEVSIHSTTGCSAPTVRRNRGQKIPRRGELYAEQLKKCYKFFLNKFATASKLRTAKISGTKYLV
jgi:hypothetical protein